MAKQTFTTGQVLTAAQMTSLQQTAMGGGSTTAKVASYVLVAADAGTVVQMNSASATTITVNTALFAAGDTVQIQNVGAGVCTVTAGTATVSTSSTLSLKQYDAGSLYFNTTSAAIFFAADAADGGSPLTTKGDLFGFSTLDARIPIGANNTILTADSAQALGLKWATPSSYTLLSTTSLTGASTTISSISGAYKDLQIVVYGVQGDTSNTRNVLRLNGVSTSTYRVVFAQSYGTANLNFSPTSAILTNNVNTGSAVNTMLVTIPNYASTAITKVANFYGFNYDNNTPAFESFNGVGSTEISGAITSLVFSRASGNLTAGTVLVYGVN